MKRILLSIPYIFGGTGWTLASHALSYLSAGSWLLMLGITDPLNDLGASPVEVQSRQGGFRDGMV